MLVVGCWLWVVGSIVQSNQQPTTNNQQPTTQNRQPTTYTPQSYFASFLTVVNTFSHLFPEKYFLSFVIPPFHLRIVTTLIINGLSKVELWVEYGWNYMKFHPYSTHNSTLDKSLSIKDITMQGWKGGITNNKKYFSEKRQEKVLTTVKNYTK